MRSEQEFRFDQFRLLPARRLLLESDRPIRLGSRALDLLTALVERAGDVVSKEELLAYAWPSTVVEETSLRFHLSALRKVLGDGQQGARFIANVSGRGYCFVGKIQRLHHAAPQSSFETSAPTVAHNLPVRLTRVIGRSELVGSIASLLSERRLISIVGPGGMGKSTLALAVCEESLTNHPDGAWFVDLAPIADSALVPSALATVLGVGIDELDPIGNLTAYLRDKRILIFIDNCERFIEAAAVLAERLLQCSRHISVIATSREPLGAKGEWIQSLPPLGFPDFQGEFTAAEAMEFPAVQLFVERAVASVDGFELTDWEASSVVGICRRLDGMPFAIELAAAHVDAFGVSGLLTQLNDQFPILSQSRRAVPERHQTLRALLDWSYLLLTESERQLLRRLAVFSASFTMEAVVAIAVDDSVARTDVVDGVVSLALKSLIVAVSGDDEVRYRLLDTTRAYALEQLEESLEADELRRRHASYLCQVLTQSEVAWATTSRSDWTSTYAAYIDDIRAALDWAIRSPDELVKNVQLAAGASALAFYLSMQAEFVHRIEKAFERYEAGAKRDPLLELHLCTSLAGLRLNLRGVTPDVEALFSRALDLARELKSNYYLDIAINGVFVLAYNKGNYPLARSHAESLANFAAQIGDASVALTADKLRALVFFSMGRLKESKRLAERVLRHPAIARRLASPYPMDVSVSMRMLLAQILWIEGNPDQAIRLAVESVELSTAEPAFAQCLALAWAACPVALWIGETELVQKFVGTLRRLSSQYSFGFHAAWGRSYRRVLSLRQGAPVDDAPDDEEGTIDVPLTSVSDIMASVGDKSLIDDAIARLHSGRAEWCAAEILRVQGDHALLIEGSEGESVAEAFYEQSLQAARNQGALSWELRTVMSISELRRRQGRAHEGRDLLASVLARFTEGFGTNDLVQAKALLARTSSEDLASTL